MSVRRERFCDLMIEEKEDILGNKPKPTERCHNPAIGRCFFCKRDYCREHAGKSYCEGVRLELSGFKQNFTFVLPCCANCQVDHLPYNPDQLVLTRLDRVWSAVKRDIRARKKLVAAKERAKREAKIAKIAKLAERAIVKEKTTANDKE